MSKELTMNLGCRTNGVQRPGLCAGWEIEYRLPGTAAEQRYVVDVLYSS